MKSKALYLVCLLSVAACQYQEMEIVKTTDNLTNKVSILYHDFENDDLTKADITTDGEFRWQDGDVMGVWPLTVDERQVGTQLSFSLTSKNGNSAVFTGSGWGLICNGNYQYTSYYPYVEGCATEAIPVTYPTSILSYPNNSVWYMSQKLLYMYALPIQPDNVASASFDYYQLGAIAKFIISAPENVFYTKIVISTHDGTNVFATSATYDLCSASSTTKPTITPTNQVNSIGMTLNNIVLTGGSKMKLNFLMCPAALAGKTLDIKLFDSHNNMYVGSVDCTKNQESGKVYSYPSTVALAAKPVIDPATIEPVDLGHPNFKFAPFNLGASSMEETGDFFAYGEVTTKTSFKTDTYSYPSITYQDTWAGCPTTAKTFDPTFDAAAQIWGNGWMTPPYGILSFLQNNCDKEWVTVNGTSGYKFYNHSDHSKWIFIPCSGYDAAGVTGLDGFNLWTSYTLSNPSGSAYMICGYERFPTSMGSTLFSWSGLAIRPVKLK